ncbi:NUDIX hydrolase, partial [Streptomyces nanshensis]
TPCAVAAAGLLYGVVALHRRLTAPLRGGRRARWVLPVVLLCGVAGALFVIAWVRQLD